MTDDPLIGMVGRHVHSPWLLGCARLFERQCREVAAAQGFPAIEPAIGAILFAAFGVEAFFNELPAETAELVGRDPIVARLRDVLLQAEEHRAQVELKFLVACAAIGRPASRGAEPFQALALLLSLRNEIAHVHSHEYTFADDGRVDAQPAALLRRLFAKSLINDPTTRPARGLMATVGTPEAAAWGIRTAQVVIDHVIDGLEDPQSRELCFFHFSPLRFVELAEARARTEGR